MLDSGINQWLAARGQLSAQRTLSKSRRAALASIYRLLDPGGRVGGIERSEMELVLRALGCPPAVVSYVLSCARADNHGRFPPSEFTRLCVEAESQARLKVSYFESPRAASEGVPLALLMDLHRIHDLVDARVSRLDGPGATRDKRALLSKPAVAAPQPNRRGDAASVSARHWPTPPRGVGLKPPVSPRKPPASAREVGERPRGRHGGWYDR